MLKHAVTLLAVGAGLCASLGAIAQYNPKIQNNPNSQSFLDAQNFQAQSYQQNQQNYQNQQAGAAVGMAGAAASGVAAANPFGQSGYTNDGTLFMGGQRIGNPHQILHDAEIPAFMGITAVRYSFTDVPSYGQGTLSQIQTDMANAPITNDPTRLFSRLYLTTTNPYTQGVATPHNNYQTYEGILTSASAASYQLTAADDGKVYAFRTLSAPNQQAMNILIKELPNTSQFKGSTDLKGGATGVHVTQNGDAAALSAYMATLKPYDFSWRAALAPYANDPNTGAFVANWVMGSHQVQAYQFGLQNQSAQTGNESFGVLAWDANQNKYVMLDPTNVQAGANNVTGNMPTLGNNQFGFFGMHTHSGSATPSGQDYAMTQQLGLDQLVVGTNGATAILTNNPGNQWQGAGFEFERSYLGGRNLAIFGSTSNAYIPQHGYIVTGADYLGDPKAVVTSFGPTFINGVPYLMKKQLGTDTSTDDIKDWLSKDGNFVLLVDKNGIPLDDKTTQEEINKVSDNLQNNPTIYYFVTQNSNSAPVTAATNNGAVNATIPGNSPGSTHSVNPTPVSYPTVDSMGVPTGGTSTY